MSSKPVNTTSSFRGLRVLVAGLLVSFTLAPFPAFADTDLLTENASNTSLGATSGMPLTAATNASTSSTAQPAAAVSTATPTTATPNSATATGTGNPSTTSSAESGGNASQSPSDPTADTSQQSETAQNNTLQYGNITASGLSSALTNAASLPNNNLNNLPASVLADLTAMPQVLAVSGDLTNTAATAVFAIAQDLKWALIGESANPGAAQEIIDQANTALQTIAAVATAAGPVSSESSTTDPATQVALDLVPQMNNLAAGSGHTLISQTAGYIGEALGNSGGLTTAVNIANAGAQDVQAWNNNTTGAAGAAAYNLTQQLGSDLEQGDTSVAGEAAGAAINAANAAANGEAGADYYQGQLAQAGFADYAQAALNPNQTSAASTTLQQLGVSAMDSTGGNALLPTSAAAVADIEQFPALINAAISAGSASSQDGTYSLAQGAVAIAQDTFNAIGNTFTQGYQSVSNLIKTATTMVNNVAQSPSSLIPTLADAAESLIGTDSTAVGQINTDVFTNVIPGMMNTAEGVLGNLGNTIPNLNGTDAAAVTAAAEQLEQDLNDGAGKGISNYASGVSNGLNTGATNAESQIALNSSAQNISAILQNYQNLANTGVSNVNVAVGTFGGDASQLLNYLDEIESQPENSQTVAQILANYTAQTGQPF